MRHSKSIPVTAVFDIGKTNKKFLLFDESYSIIYKQQTMLDQIEDDDGDPCEDLDQLVRWIRKKFRDSLENDNFEIKAVNFSTYGATLVHLDEKGEPVTPLYNYLKPFPDYLEQQFYDRYGGRKQFSVETASPPMGMLNSGLQLYWLKYQKPKKYSKIRCTLHFPQYVSYLFTGNNTSELTSVGCHTGLWNYRQNTWHRWLDEEDMKHLLPEIKPVEHTCKVTSGRTELNVGIGIHDSSAALAPYLYLLDEPFMLISTGTWSIVLNPFNATSLTYEELRRDCLSYMNIYGNPVKASRLFLGQEYMHQKQRMDTHFNRKPTQTLPEINPGLFKQLMAKDGLSRKLQLEKAHMSGPYPSEKPGNWELANFDSYEEAYHQLMLDLVSIQADCIRLAEGPGQPDKMIVTGGFSQNDFFMRLLATKFPDKKVYTTSLPHASALGAAMVVNNGKALEKEVQKELLTLDRHEPLPDTGIENYRWSSQIVS